MIRAHFRNQFLGIALLLLIVISHPVSACTCIVQTVEEQVSSADVVFAGEVTRVQNPNLNPFIGTGNRPLQVYFEVSETWKGDAEREQLVFTPLNSAACGINFEAGNEYIVLAQEGEEGLGSTLCSGTVLLADGGEIREYLNPVPGTNTPKEILDVPFTHTDIPVPTPIELILGGTALVIIIGAYWISRNVTQKPARAIKE